MLLFTCVVLVRSALAEACRNVVAKSEPWYCCSRASGLVWLGLALALTVASRAAALKHAGALNLKAGCFLRR